MTVFEHSIKTSFTYYSQHGELSYSSDVKNGISLVNQALNNNYRFLFVLKEQTHFIQLVSAGYKLQSRLLFSSCERFSRRLDPWLLGGICSPMRQAPQQRLGFVSTGIQVSLVRPFQFPQLSQNLNKLTERPFPRGFRVASL